MRHGGEAWVCSAANTMKWFSSQSICQDQHFKEYKNTQIRPQCCRVVSKGNVILALHFFYLLWKCTSRKKELWITAVLTQNLLLLSPAQGELIMAGNEFTSNGPCFHSSTPAPWWRGVSSLSPSLRELCHVLKWTSSESDPLSSWNCDGCILLQVALWQDCCPDTG